MLEKREEGTEPVTVTPVLRHEEKESTVKEGGYSEEENGLLSVLKAQKEKRGCGGTDEALFGGECQKPEEAGQDDRGTPLERLQGDDSQGGEA